MADLLTLPKSVLANDVFSFLNSHELLSFRTMSKNWKAQVDNLLALRIEYLTQKLNTGQIYQLSEESARMINGFMQNGMKGLNSLTQASIVEMKGFANPPPVVANVMQLLYVIVKAEPKVPTWNEVRTWMSEASFLAQLMNYDTKPMKNEFFDFVQELASNPNLALTKIRSVSSTAHSFMLWCDGIIQLNRVYQNEENQSPQRRLRKEIRVINNVLNAQTLMKKTPVKTSISHPAKTLAKGLKKPVTKTTDERPAKLALHTSVEKPSKPAAKSLTKSSTPNFPVIFNPSPTKKSNPIPKKK